MKLIKIVEFTADELANEDYHAEVDHISGSALTVIHNECPAAWRFAGESTSKALEFGIASHAAILEPEKFNNEFVRGLDKSDFPDALTSDVAIKAWLKGRGVKGYSGKNTEQLINMCANTGENVDIWTLMLEAFEVSNMDATIVPAKDFDQIGVMRDVVFGQEENVKLLSGGKFEHSYLATIDIEGELYQVKIRPDCVNADGAIMDYTTTRSVNPNHFGKQAHDMGYWLKLALQSDLLSMYLGKKVGAGLLAQDKKEPFITQMYWLTDDQLAVGREQYKYALRLHGICKEQDAWPAYSDGAMELPTPVYLANKYGIDLDNDEIKFED